MPDKSRVLAEVIKQKLVFGGFLSTSLPHTLSHGHPAPLCQSNRGTSPKSMPFLKPIRLKCNFPYLVALKASPFMERQQSVGAAVRLQRPRQVILKPVFAADQLCGALGKSHHPELQLWHLLNGNLSPICMVSHKGGATQKKSFLSILSFLSHQNTYHVRHVTN